MRLQLSVGCHEDAVLQLGWIPCIVGLNQGSIAKSGLEQLLCGVARAAVQAGEGRNEVTHKDTVFREMSFEESNAVA